MIWIGGRIRNLKPKSFYLESNRSNVRRFVCTTLIIKVRRKALRTLQPFVIASAFGRGDLI